MFCTRVTVRQGLNHNVACVRLGKQTFSNRPSHSRSLIITNAKTLLLEPCGDLDKSHIQNPEDVPAPTPIKLKEGLFEVGRVESADLVVQIPTVSARHAMIRVSDVGLVSVTDLGSTNGTFVDGQELEPMASVSSRFIFSWIFKKQDMNKINVLM